MIKSLFGFKAKKAVPHTAQETLPFKHIYPNGTCDLGNGKYNKCIEFFDTAYELADLADQLSLFERYEELLNSFNDKVEFQFCYLNQKYSSEEIEELISVPKAKDKHDKLRYELDKFLKLTQQTSTLGLIKKKFLIFTIEAPDIKSATVRLNQLESQVLFSFKRLSVRAYPMLGTHRIKTLYRTLNRHKKFKTSNGSYEYMKRIKKLYRMWSHPMAWNFLKRECLKWGGRLQYQI